MHGTWRKTIVSLGMGSFYDVFGYIMQALPTIAFFMCIGSVTGFMSGLLGVGGGLILVPAILFWLGHGSIFVDQAVYGVLIEPDRMMHVALATCFAVMLPTVLFSVRTHLHHNNIRWQAVRLMAPFQIIGVSAGTLFADSMKSNILTIVFSVGILCLSYLMFRPLGNRMQLQQLPSMPVAGVAGSFIGFFSSLIGIGGATMNVPFLVFHGVAFRQAIGTASALGLFISLPAAIFYVVWGVDSSMAFPVLGYVHLVPFILIVPFSMFFAPVGARYTQLWPVDRIRIIFAVLMCVVSFVLFFKAI